MLSQREKCVIDRIDGVLREVSRLSPSNPADIRAISVNLRTATTATQQVSRAITALRAGDWDSVTYHLDAAVRTVRDEQEGGPTRG